LIGEESASQMIKNINAKKEKRRERKRKIMRDEMALKWHKIRLVVYNRI
jgi:hypothetical protein